MIALVGPLGRQDHDHRQDGRAPCTAPWTSQCRADHHRQLPIGARDQLQTYARILNVPVRTATTPEEMDESLNLLGDRRLILVDTAGMAAAHERVADQRDTLAAAGAASPRCLRCRPPPSPAAIQRALAPVRRFSPDACVLTKAGRGRQPGRVCWRHWCRPICRPPSSPTATRPRRTCRWCAPIPGDACGRVAGREPGQSRPGTWHWHSGANANVNV